jgi:hypothetical protein
VSLNRLKRRYARYFGPAVLLALVALLPLIVPQTSVEGAPNQALATATALRRRITPTSTKTATATPTPKAATATPTPKAATATPTATKSATATPTATPTSAPVTESTRQLSCKTTLVDIKGGATSATGTVETVCNQSGLIQVDLFLYQGNTYVTENWVPNGVNVTANVPHRDTITVTAAPGTYDVKIGIFQGNEWKLILWNDNAGQVTIGAPPAATPPTGGAIWTGDMEEGDTGDWWAPAPARVEGNNCGGEYNNAPASSQAESSVAHSGRYGVQLRVPDMNTGSSRGARLVRWCEPRQYEALYYSAWYYIPQRVQVDSWWSIMEWKSNGSHNAKFMVGVANRPNGNMYLYLGRGQDSGGGMWSQSQLDVPVGRWFQVEAYVRKATDGSGRVTLWQDGVQLIDVTGVATANSDDLSWAVINYGQYTSPADVTIYADDARISTSRNGPR